MNSNQTTNCLIILNPRQIPACMESFERLNIDKAYFTGFYESQLVEPLNQFIADNDYLNYLIASDDLIVSQEALDIVEGLLLDNPRATGYCRVADDSPFFNVSRFPLEVADGSAKIRDYHFYRYDDKIDDYFTSWFGGWTLTGMRKSEWLKHPFRVLPDTQIQSDYATCLDVDNVFACHKDTYCHHVREEMDNIDKSTFVIGKVKPNIRHVKTDIIQFDIENDEMLFALSSIEGSIGGGITCPEKNCISSDCGCEFSCVTPNVESGTMLEYQITSVGDDGFWACGSLCSNTQLALGDYNPMTLLSNNISALAVDGYPASLWLTFRGIEVPQGDDVIINKAFITLKNKNYETGSIHTDITAVCGAENSLDISCDDDRPYTLDRLATHIPWNEVTPWNTDQEYVTADIACVVQEKISTDWESGDDITFLIICDEEDNAAGAVRYPYGYEDGTGEDAPKLTIYYDIITTVGGGLLAGGAAQMAKIAFNLGSGGILCGGSATISVSGEVFDEEMSGGLLVNCSSSSTKIVFESGNGGVIASGLALSLSNFTSFTYRVSITVPAGSVSEDLENFYLGVSTDVDPEHVFYDVDFQITDESSVKIYHDLRSYNPSSGLVIIYFRCDLLSESDNVFYLEYGGII